MTGRQLVILCWAVHREAVATMQVQNACGPPGFMKRRRSKRPGGRGKELSFGYLDLVMQVRYTDREDMELGEWSCLGRKKITVIRL